MKKETINATYLSPVTKVVKVEIRQVIAGSGLEDYQKGSDIDDFGF